MSSRIHALAGFAAVVTITLFLSATIISEVSGDPNWIVRVKTSIPWGFFILIPALAATGGSGMKLSKGRAGELISRKQTRMKLIAGNGILVLLPAAFFLAWKASNGDIDLAFYAVQGFEILFGAINLMLLTQNARDGIRMTRRKRASA